MHGALASFLDVIFSVICLDYGHKIQSFQGKKQGMRIQSLAALEKTIRNVLDILGLMPASYHEVPNSISTFEFKISLVSFVNMTMLMPFVIKFLRFA